MIRVFVALLALLLLPVAARAQSVNTYCGTGGGSGPSFWQPCTGSGSGGASAALTSTNASGTISVTNTFQQVFAVATTRKGCLIQNNSTNGNNQYVYEHGSGQTVAKSYTLTPGGSYSCNRPAGVVQNEIDITGTAGDTFAADSQ